MLKEQARRTAVGMCLHLSAGREDEANMLLRMYIEDAVRSGFPPIEAFSTLSLISVSLAVAAAEDREEWLSDIAQSLAVEA